MLQLGITIVILPWMASGQNDQTSVTDMLNGMIATSGDGNVYCGGRGVVIRNPFDGYAYDEQKTVVPATFWVNDILVPSQIYPDYDFNELAGLAGAAYRAAVAFVIGENIGELLPDIDNVQSDDWGWGVFYATDSNAADMRCRYQYDNDGWDCPEAWVNSDGSVIMDVDAADGSKHLGTGIYGFGNPYAEGGGGGTGPHWDVNDNGMGGQDQENACDDHGVCLTRDFDSQCNYDLKGNGWADWVDHWLAHDSMTTGTFASVDRAGCWVNNIRDLINLQNSMFRVKGSPLGNGPPQENWGWNEIPLDRVTLGNAENWDAVMIHLPSEICKIQWGGGDDDVACLDDDSQWRLEATLDHWVEAGYLFPGMENIGNRPGSYVVFAREFWQDDGSEQGSWFRWFFCDYWMSPSGKYETVSFPWGIDNGNGACAIQYAGASRGNKKTLVASRGATDTGRVMLV